MVYMYNQSLAHEELHADDWLKVDVRENSSSYQSPGTLHSNLHCARSDILVNFSPNDLLTSGKGAL
jgi:hypothetical protein